MARSGGDRPGAVPVECQGRFDPRTVPIEGGSGESKFRFVRALILTVPPEERFDVARILFRRMPAASNHLWAATECRSADGGMYWLGQGRGFIFALDRRGNAFCGHGSDVTTTREGRTTVNYPVLRPLPESDA